MATINVNKDKNGNTISYRFRCCVGRDDQNKQIWRTCTIPRPDGFTPAKERKEIERLADAWQQKQIADYKRAPKSSDKSKITLEEFVKEHPYLFDIKLNRIALFHDSFTTYLRNKINNQILILELVEIKKPD